MGNQNEWAHPDENWVVIKQVISLKYRKDARPLFVERKIIKSLQSINFTSETFSLFP